MTLWQRMEAERRRQKRMEIDGARLLLRDAVRILIILAITLGVLAVFVGLA